MTRWAVGFGHVGGYDAYMTRGAELMCTGTELLIGRTVNTHVQRLALALEPLGLELTRETSVPDHRETIAKALREARTRSEILFVTGGLGPTNDDVTREAVADVLGRSLRRDPESLERIRQRCLRLGQAFTESRQRQADVVDGAVVLTNPVGAAPGERIELEDGRVWFLLPGPPREFEAILETQVLPWLAVHRPGRPRLRRLWMVCGLGESDVMEVLKQAGFEPGPLELAWCAAPGALEVRLTAEPEHADWLERAAQVVRAALGPHVYAEERLDLVEVVARQLRSRGATLAVAESCTGGWLAARLTTYPGSSDWFRGGIVAYANEVKIQQLGVPEPLLATHGAVSEAVALAMARGVRERLGATIGVGITGIAGPTGGTPEKPVGLVWWAVADETGAAAVSRRFPGDRELVRRWAAQFALDHVRRRLLGLPPVA